MYSNNPPAARIARDKCSHPIPSKERTLKVIKSLDLASFKVKGCCAIAENNKNSQVRHRLNIQTFLQDAVNY
jgi:hypothetical protein